MKDLLPKDTIKVSFSNLERLAFDVETPDHLAKQHQNTLEFLKGYIPCRESRIDIVDRFGSLRLLPDGRIIYSEIALP